MPTRKMRVELLDGEGNRYTISLEGQITRDKAVKLLDLVELLGAIPNQPNGSSATLTNNGDLSKLDRLRMTIHRSFPLVWFTSKDAQAAYEQEHKEPISLSTAATYLGRLTKRGTLNKAGNANNLKYRLILTPQHAQMSSSYHK